MPRFHILNSVVVSLLVKDHPETLIEPLIHRKLHKHYSLFGRSPRNVDTHIRVCILENDTLGNSTGLFRNPQTPHDLLRFRVLLTELQNTVTIRIEKTSRALFLTNGEDVWVYRVRLPLDPKELSLTPISKNQFQVLSEVLNDESRECMHDLIRISFCNVFNHPDLMQILVIWFPHAWCLLTVVSRFLGTHHQGAVCGGLDYLVVITLLKFDLLHMIIRPYIKKGPQYRDKD